MTRNDKLRQIADRQEELARRCRENSSGLREKISRLEDLRRDLRQLESEPPEDREPQLNELYLEFTRLTRGPQWRGFFGKDEPDQEERVGDPEDHLDFATFTRAVGIVHQEYVTAGDPDRSLFPSPAPGSAPTGRPGAGGNTAAPEKGP
jgi:hypothetical protein